MLACVLVIRTLRAIPLNFNKNAIVKFRFSFGIVEIQENPSALEKKGSVVSKGLYCSNDMIIPTRIIHVGMLLIE